MKPPVGQRELVALLYGQATTGLLVNVMVAALVAWLLRGSVPDDLLATWCIAVWVLAGLRGVLILAYHRRSDPDVAVGLWERLFVAGAGGMGILWGITIPLFGPHLAVGGQALLAMVLAGYVAGAIPVLASVLLAFVTHMVTTLGPPIAWLFLQNTDHHTNVGFMGLILALALLSTARNYHRSLSHSLRLAYENGELVQELSAANEEAHVINDRLLEEVSERRRAEEALRESERRLTDAATEREFLFERMGDFVYSHDARGEYRYVSPSVESICGYTPEEWKARHARYMTDNAINRLARMRTREALETGHEPPPFLVEVIHRAGYNLLLEVSERTYTTENGDTGIIGVARDVTERERASQQLRQLSMAVEQSPISVMITDEDGVIEYVNRKVCEVTGYSRAELLGARPSLLRSGNTPDEVYQDLWNTILDGAGWRGELQNRRKDGALFWEDINIAPVTDSEGDISHFVALKEDTSVRRDYEARLQRQASYDQLTDLPNRSLALDRLAQALARSGRANCTVGLMLVDLDHFKTINESLGHDAGDRVLRESGARLKRCVRAEDTVARLGGDEFLLVLPEISASVDAERVCRKVLEAFTTPVHVDGQNVFVGASMGIAIHPGDGDDAPLMLRNAEAALNQAKAQGRSDYRFFTPELNRRAVERLSLETHLRYALDRGEFLLNFQPMIALDGETVAGAEALLRWDNPELGFVPPDRFIPVAEETGIIHELGEWVLDEACAAMTRWKGLPSAPGRIAVNVSARQFGSGDIERQVAETLRRHDLAPAQLELEITEGLLLADNPETTIQLERLNALGVRLSVDDFGTGYSALSYLNRFPFDTLKIDRSFVRDVTTDAGSAALANAIIAMAQSLGLQVVGEGVENTDQLAFLRANGCDLVQGYYFSRPVPLQGLLEFLRARRATSAGARA